jgi:hypothetical protein
MVSRPHHPRLRRNGIGACQHGLQTASSTLEAQRHWLKASIGMVPALSLRQHQIIVGIMCFVVLRIGLRTKYETKVMGSIRYDCIS